MSKISEMIREKFGATDRKRDEGLTTPEDIVRYDDIPYGNDEKWQILDVYRPKNAEGKLPVIVSVHGGGWVYGDKEAYQFYCMSLAQRGFAVVNFNYRLAPENKFPAPLQDTSLVFGWLKQHDEEYGFDLNNVFALGDSAGANILECYCSLCCNEEYYNSFEPRISAPLLPKVVALNCGVNIVRVSDDPKDRFTNDLMSDYLKDKSDTSQVLQVNGISHITPAFPPVFLMSAEDDFLKYQMVPVIEKLVANNVEFTVRFYKDEKVRLSHVFHLDIRLEAADRCNSEECAFFRSFIS